MMYRPRGRTSFVRVSPAVAGTVRSQAMMRAASWSFRCPSISDGMKSTLVPSGFTPLRKVVTSSPSL
jgi:hypothetical protein